MTDDQLDRYYRHQDSGQHGEDDEPQTPPDWLGWALLAMALLLCFGAGYGLYWFISAAWRWS